MWHSAQQIEKPAQRVESKCVTSLSLLFFSVHSGNLTKRIVYSILIEVLVFVVTVVLAMINSSEWPGAFFWITMTTVVILNSAYIISGRARRFIDC